MEVDCGMLVTMMWCVGSFELPSCCAYVAPQDQTEAQALLCRNLAVDVAGGNGIDSYTDALKSMLIDILVLGQRFLAPSFNQSGSSQLLQHDAEQTVGML